MKKPALALALGLVLMASCTGESATATKEEPTHSAEPSADPKAIRAFDFAATRWFDTPRDHAVTLAGEPVGDIEVGLYELGDMPVTFGDVNGDGLEDAMASLSRTQGNGVSLIWYVWLWDAEKKTASQLLDPIAESTRCGTAITGVTATDSAFELREQYRDPYDITADCASEPPNKVTRTIAVLDGRPIQQEGFGGYGGMCPQPPPGDADSSLIEDTKLYAAGDDSAPRVEHQDIDAIHGLSIQGMSWLENDVWALVAFTAVEGSKGFAEYGTYLPCAWSRKS